MQIMQTNRGADGLQNQAGRTFTSVNDNNGQGWLDWPALRAAIYARYSTDGQKETSIDDQIRACQEAAKRRGLNISQVRVFSDDAITGAAKGTQKREQWHALRDAIRAGEIDILLSDQQCRLARHTTEAMSFFDDLKAHGVWLVTADGFDSKLPTAQLLFGIKSVFSEFFLDETRHRVRRGMVGEFDRGAMVTAVPYGYEVDVVRSAEAGRCVWSVHPERAAVVKLMFGCRKDGMSLHQIAAVLNGRRVATSREGKEKEGLFWRGSGVWRILQNPIYKGVYVVNFGGQAAEDHQSGQRLVTELALVSAEDWDACQSKGKRSPPANEAGLPGAFRRRAQRGSYGGGKHPLAGVLRCGTCGVALSCHKAATDAGTMHCIQCEHATSAGVPGRQPLYLSIKGVRQMLRWLLEKVIAGEAITRYQECLRDRLANGRDGELTATRHELGKLEGARDRIGRLLRQLHEDDPVLEREYMKAREEVLLLERKVRELEDGVRQLNHEAIQRQLDIDMSAVVDAFLSDQSAPERTRALLNRVFPSIVLKGKTDRYTAIFEVHVKPGAILAEASGTSELVDGAEVMWVRLQTSGSKYPVWTVEEIPAADACSQP